MRKEVEQLALMGAMSDEADERITAALVDEYADLLGKIVKPVTLDEAHILIKLFPPTCFIWDRMDITTFNRVCVFRNKIS